jgi:hypothetical protein
VKPVRVYVPSSPALLSQVVMSGGVGPVPVAGHAVTDELRAGYPEGGEEEWEYAAMTAAAVDSIGLLTEEDPPRRVVIALDATVLPVEGGAEPTLVEVSEAVPFRDVAAVHMDSAEAERDVAAARDCWAQAERGDEQATATVERCLEHELGWYAAQEIGDLVTWG